MKLHLSPLTLIYFAICLLLSHQLTLAAVCSAVFVHELVHLIVLWMAGGRAVSLTVTPMGLSIERAGLLSHIAEVILSLSAPVANLLLAAIYARFSLDPCTVEANLGFGLLNLLPILPLDGGKALKACLQRYLTPASAERTVRCVSSVCLLLLWLLAVASALVLDGSMSLLLFSVGLFFADAELGNSHK